MKTKALRHPATPIALAAALLAAFLVLFSPLSASAHDALVSSSPAADSSVETVPSDLTLTFSAKLIDGEGATEVVVTDPSGATVTEGPATVDGAIVTQPLSGSGPAGAYHVVWKVVSSDGHPTSGEFSFTVTAGDEAATDAPTTAPATTAPATAAPTDQTPTPASPAPTAPDDAGASAWIWVLVVLAVLIVIGVAVWLTMRRRGGTAPSDSDAPTER